MSSNPKSEFESTNTNKQAVRLEIEATNRTPEIKMDGSKGLISIKGVSMPANVNQFYSPLLERLDQYMANPKEDTRVVFDLEYVNSSSSQMILAILFKLKTLVDKGNNLKIDWHYVVEDEDIYETGKSYSELSGITFNFHERE